MNNFTLPPPPPPPPKAAPGADFFHHQSHNGRGNRGSFRGRGRGSDSRGPFRGGGFNAQPSHYHQRNNQDFGPASTVTAQNHLVPRNNAGTPSSGSNLQSSAPNYGPSPNGTAVRSRAGPSQLSHLGFNFAPGGPGTFKRKREGNDQRYSQQQKPKPVTKPKLEVAPAVPSFGFSLPIYNQISAPPAPKPAGETNLKTEKQPVKRKSNQLGLTPQGDVAEESEEEAVDEEAAYTAYTGPLRVEYNGTVIDLGSAEALRQWREERRKKWPTKERIEERKKQALKARQDALRKKLEDDQERKRELEARMKGHEDRRRAEKKAEQDAKDRKALEKHLAKAQKLQRKLGIKKAETEHNSTSPRVPTDEVKDGPENKVVDRGLVTSTKDVSHSSNPEEPADGNVSSTEELFEIEEDESSDSDSDSSASAPDETTSKGKGQIAVAPPKREPIKRPCQEFMTSGRCRRGTQCRFQHETSSRITRERSDRQTQTIPSKRTTLYQRLVEQEQKAEDLLALRAVKYLGQQGVLI